jgi:hypothetical protein
VDAVQQVDHALRGAKQPMTPFHANHANGRTVPSDNQQSNATVNVLRSIERIAPEEPCVCQVCGCIPGTGGRKRPS